jgi:hypothetical protein
MAHFARLDEINVVVDVVVVSNADVLDSKGKEVEALGIAVCEAVVGPGPWIQTSYNDNFRRRYAGIGMTYSAEHDAFILPQPYPSWTLDIDDPDDWVAPVPKPTDEGYWYEWDEDDLAWVAHEIIEEPLGEE